MQNRLYKRLVNDATKTISDDKARLQVNFRWMLKILLATVLFLAVINIITGQIRQGIILAGIALSFYIQYWIVYILKDKGATIVSVTLNIEAILICTYMIVTGGVDGFSPIWILIMPMFTLILLGRKNGTISNIEIFILFVFFFWTPIGRSSLQYPYSDAFMFRLPIVFLSLSIIMLYTETLRIYTVKELVEARKKMEAVYQNEYSTMKSRITEARRARHDIRHHFVMINTYINDGKYEEAKNYIDQYYKALPFEESLTYCEHYQTNALLTYFVQRAKADNIAYEVKVNFPSDMDIPADDLTVILGNLLENALDASVQSTQEDPGFETFVSVKGTFQKNLLLLTVENNTLHQAKQDEKNRFISTKHEGVGIGIDSSRTIAEKYNGYLRIEQSEGKFTANVALNLTK